jgi:hypothetical protein
MKQKSDCFLGYDKPVIFLQILPNFLVEKCCQIINIFFASFSGQDIIYCKIWQQFFFYFDKKVF